jgi:hypothetical protein
MSDQATETGEERGKRAIMEEIINVLDRFRDGEAPLTDAEKLTARKCCLFTAFAFKLLPDAVNLAILETVISAGRRMAKEETPAE